VSWILLWLIHRFIFLGEFGLLLSFFSFLTPFDAATAPLRERSLCGCCHRLQGEAKRQGIEIRRGIFESLDELFTAFPSANAYFNCTGLGAYSLKGVQDKNVYPTRVCFCTTLDPKKGKLIQKQGQIMLVESPKTPMTRMYFRSPQRVNKDTTYVFPRGPHNGVVLGGVRLDNNWSGDVDLEFAEDIKKRCCALAPELGKPEDLKVIYHGVGLRREFELCLQIWKRKADGTKQQAEKAGPDWREKGLVSVWSFTIMELAVLDIKLRGRLSKKIILYSTDCGLGAWPRKPSIRCRKALVFEHVNPLHGA
jgi:hypothetical protein